MNAKKVKKLRRAALFDPNAEREHVVKQTPKVVDTDDDGKPVVKMFLETTVRNHPRQSRALYQQLKRVAKR